MSTFKVGFKRPALKVPNVLDRTDLLKIGAKAVQSINDRVERGVGVNDRPMKALSKPYANKKRKQGQPAIRNMEFSGRMLGAMAVVDTEINSVTIGFTRESERKKAEFNQARSPWFGLSRNDNQIMRGFVSRMMKSK